MEVFQAFLNKIEDPENKAILTDVLSWVRETYPDLVPVVKWNQPMFTDHGTYIIGFSFSKKHFAVAPEAVTIQHFSDDIKQANYEYTDNIIKIRWEQDIDYSLLAALIDFNILDKIDYSSFWR